MSEAFNLEIEICPIEPRASLADDIGDNMRLASDMLDCTRSGDVEPACRHVLATWSPRFIIADPTLGFKRRTAKPSEVQATAEAIYYDHEKGEFADMTKASLYLIWESASQYAIEESEKQESES